MDDWSKYDVNKQYHTMKTSSPQKLVWTIEMREKQSEKEDGEAAIQVALIKWQLGSGRLG